MENTNTLIINNLVISYDYEARGGGWMATNDLEIVVFRYSTKDKVISFCEGYKHPPKTDADNQAVKLIKLRNSLSFLDEIGKKQKRKSA